MGSRCRPNNSQVLTVPGMRSQLTTHGRDLMLAVPPAALLSKDNADTAGFAIAWNGAIAAWTLGVVSAGSVVGALFSLPFWFAGMSSRVCLCSGMSGRDCEGTCQWAAYAAANHLVNSISTKAMLIVPGGDCLQWPRLPPQEQDWQRKPLRLG